MLLEKHRPARLDGQIVKWKWMCQGLALLRHCRLPDTSVRESRTGLPVIKNSGFEFPVKRITVNSAGRSKRNAHL